MNRIKYLDFELKIEREGKLYRARVLNSPTGKAEALFELPFSDEKIENLVLKIFLRKMLQESGNFCHGI